MNMSQALSEVKKAKLIRDAANVLHEYGYIDTQELRGIQRKADKGVMNAQSYLDVVPKVEAMVNALLQGSNGIDIRINGYKYATEWSELSETEQSAFVDAYLKAHSDEG